MKKNFKGQIGTSLNIQGHKECPECLNRLVRKEGKFGKFFGCSDYPSCKYTKSL